MHVSTSQHGLEERKVLLLGDAEARGKEIIQGLQDVARMTKRTEIYETNSVLSGHLGVRDLTRADEPARQRWAIARERFLSAATRENDVKNSVPIWNLLHVDGVRCLKDQIGALDSTTSSVFILLNGESPWSMKVELTKWIFALRDIMAMSRMERGGSEDNTNFPPLHVIVNKCEHLDTLSVDLQQALSFHLRSDCLAVDASLLYMVEKTHYFKHIYATIMETLFNYKTPMRLTWSANTESPCIWIPSGYDTQEKLDSMEVNTQLRDIHSLYAQALLNQVLSVDEFNRVLTLSTGQSILAANRRTKKSILVPSGPSLGKQPTSFLSRMSVRFDENEEAAKPAEKTNRSETSGVQKGSILRRSETNDVPAHRSKTSGTIMSSDSPRDCRLTESGTIDNNDIWRLKTFESTLIHNNGADSMSALTYMQPSDIQLSVEDLDRQTAQYDLNCPPLLQRAPTSSTNDSMETMSEKEYSRRLDEIRNKRRALQDLRNSDVRDIVMNHRTLKKSQTASEVLQKRKRKKEKDNNQSTSITFHYAEMLQRRTQSFRLKNKELDVAKVREMVDAGLDLNAEPRRLSAAEARKRELELTAQSSIRLTRLRELRKELTGLASPKALQLCSRKSATAFSMPAKTDVPGAPLTMSNETPLDVDFDGVSDVSFSCSGSISNRGSVCSSLCCRTEPRSLAGGFQDISATDAKLRGKDKRTERSIGRRQRCDSIATGTHDAKYQPCTTDQSEADDILFGRNQCDPFPKCIRNTNEGSEVLKEFADDFSKLSMLSDKKITLEPMQSPVPSSCASSILPSELPFDDMLTLANDLANELKGAEIEDVELEAVTDDLPLDASLGSGMSVRTTSKPILHLPPPKPVSYRSSASGRSLEYMFSSLAISSSINDAVEKISHDLSLRDLRPSTNKDLFLIVEESPTSDTTLPISAGSHSSPDITAIRHCVGLARTSTIIPDEGIILPPSAITPKYRKHNAHDLKVNVVRSMMVKQGPSIYTSSKSAL